MPQKILEVGVSAGGTTAVILNCMDKLGLKETQLHSIDLLPYAYKEPEKPTGYVAAAAVPHMEAQWTLRTGYMVAHWMEEIGGEIDFVVLDTAHCLPGELLDFLCFLPYLKPGATVVLHDLQLHYRPGRKDEFATHLLLQTVVADKILCRSEGTFEPFPNIGAFRITADTQHCIDNLFYALCLPWSYLPAKQEQADISKLLCAHYNTDQLECYRDALRRCEHTHQLKCVLRANQSVGFWGTGYIGGELALWLRAFKQEDMNLATITAVDSNPHCVGQSIEGFCIQEPAQIFVRAIRPEHVIICVRDPSSQNEMIAQLLSWGYAKDAISSYCNYLLI